MRLPGKDDPLVIKGSLFISLIALALWLKFITVDFDVAAVLNWPFFDIPLPDTLRFFMRALAVSPASLGAILCLLLPASFFPPKRRAAALITAAFLVTILVVTDRIFMRYYSDIFIFHDIVLAPQAGQLTRSIRHLLKISDLLLFSDILIWTWLLASGRLRVVWQSGRKIRIVILAAILISAAVQFASVHHLKACRP
ncbi:MAG: hypothetical protein HUJ86_02825, partial [Synergistes sp.]|nr:hypothetical protein [Synergistes sp.]